MTKTVTDLFNEILVQAQSIEHMNDVAVKFIEEVKMHDKILKHFRLSLCDLNSISSKRQQYSSNNQHASLVVLNKVELFDKRYANLLAKIEEYVRLFIKHLKTIGQTINLPIDAASTIVQLYRSTIVSRYNIILESLVSSDEDEQQSFIKRNQQNKTGFIDLSHGKVTVNQHPLSSIDGSISFETTYLIPETNILSSSSSIDNDRINNNKVNFIIQKQQPLSSSSSSITNDNIIITSSKLNEMTSRKNFSFIDAVNNARSAYVVDTLEQRSYDLREAYSRGLINTTNHHIIDRATSRQLDLGEALKMGILKVGDSQSYNVISKTESLIISRVFDHCSNAFIDPNAAIRAKILDPYHGLYLNNATQESISIDDAMSKGFVLVEQQQPQQSSSSNNHNHHHPNDKYVISTSLIRETRSYHLLGVRDYINNKELTVQEAIQIGILDKQNGQYINRKTNEIFSISEAIAQGHIRAQPLPIESTTNQENSGTNTNIKRGTVKETKTYTLKSAIHPKTRQEIPIRLAIDEGIIDHAKGFYVNSLTGENLPISVAIEKGLIFTELIDQHPRRFIKTLIIEQVIDPVTNRRLGVTEAIKTGLLNSNITIYYHSVTQKQMTILEAYEQGLIIGKFRDQHPSTFYGDQHEQVFYLITGVIDIRTDKVYNLQEGIQQKLFDHKKGVYIHPLTGDEINIGDAVKRGFIQVQAVSSQIIFNNTDHQLLTDKRRAIISQEPYGNNTNDSRSKLSIRIESQSRPRTPYEINESEILQREKDVVEIESVQRLPRHSKQQQQQHRIREEEIFEKHTTNVFDRECIMTHHPANNVRPKSSERQKQEYIEEVIIDDGINNNRRAKFDIKEDRHTSHREIVIESDRYMPPPLPPKDHLVINGSHREHEVRVVQASRPQPLAPPPRPVHIDDRQREGQRIHHGEIFIEDHQRPYNTSTQTTVTKECIDITDNRSKPPPPPVINTQQQQTNEYHFDEQQSWTEEEWEQWHCTMMIKGEPYRVIWVMNTMTGDRLPLQTAYQRGLVDIKQRLFFDEKLNRKSYTFEEAVELGYMGIEPDTASLPLHVDGIDYMIHWVLDSSTKRRIFPRQAVRKQILDAVHGRYINPYNNSQVSLHEAIYLKFIGATEYNSTNDSITVTINRQTYTIKWVYDTRNMKKILPRDALKQGILDIQLNEYRKVDTNDVLTIYDAIQAGYIRCNDDESSSDNSVRPPSIISIDEDELTIATKTATYVITSVIHPLTQKEIKVSEAIDLGILDKDIGSYRDLVTNVQYELAEAINEGLVYATIIETKEDTEMLTSSVQEIIKKFIVKSVAVDSESLEKIGGLEAQAIGILNYAQGIYHDRKSGVKIPLDKAIEKKLLDVELVSQKRFEEYDLELITDTITEKRITLYRIHGVRNNVLDRMESGAIAVKNQMIDTETKTYTDFSTGESMTIQEAINRNLIEAEISEHVERKPLGLSMQNAIRLGFYVAETGTFRDPATEHYMTLMEAIERGHIHVNGMAFADSEQGPITLYDAFSLGLINRRDGGKLNPPKISLYRARLVESKLHRMNVEDAIRCGLLNLRTGLYKHPHSGEQLHLKEAIQRGLIDGQSTIIEHPTSGRYMTLKDALDGIRIDHEGQVIDSYSNKTITTLELAFNHRKLFSQFDVNAGEVFLPLQNESVDFEKAIRKNLLDNNRMKLFDPKTSREYSIQDAIERGLVDGETGLIYDSHSHTQYSVREAIRHGIVAIVGAPLVPIKADHETVAAKITSRKHRRHSLVKSSLHYDYNSAPDSADEDSHGSGGGGGGVNAGWHRIKSRTRAISPLSIDDTLDLKRNIRRRTGSSPTGKCRDDDWKTGWKNGHNDDDDTYGNGGGSSKRNGGGNTFYSSSTSRVQQSNTSSNRSQGGQTSSGFQQKNETTSSLSTVIPKEQDSNEFIEHNYEILYDILPTPIKYIINKENNLLRLSEANTKAQNNENRLILDIHNIAGRLTSLHNQLNQYVYLTENLDQLRTNVKHIKVLHLEIEQEKLTMDNLIERTKGMNPQLTILSTDLEEKRVEISDINNGLSNIIERFITNIDQFNMKYIYLMEWIEENENEIQKSLQLSTLNVDNDNLKNILNTGIHLQNDLQSLQEYLQTIHVIIQDFQQAIDNTDNGKSENIFQEFQQRYRILSKTYSDFLKRCKHISDQCERSIGLFNEVNNFDKEFLKSINEFDQHLTINEKEQKNDDTLQILLLNVQQHLDKLRMLAIHEPASPSIVITSNNHIMNQIKEHLYTLLDSHTQRYDDSQKRLMNHLELIQRFLHERQTIKQNIDELYNWLTNSLENNFHSQPFSLKRSKLDEQIISFRQFHAQLRTRRYAFDSDINTTINLENLLDRDDKHSLKLIEQHFQSLNEHSQQYNEQINHLCTHLNEFHLEHAYLIDTYSKNLRLYTEQIEQNDDINFSALQLLLNNDQDLILDHTSYNKLIEELLQTNNITDENEIIEHKNQVNEYKNQYERFQNDLKLILQNRQSLYDEYELMRNDIQEWLLTTDRLLKQQLTIDSCEQLLHEHSTLPIEQLKFINKQLVEFYSSANLLDIYEHLKLSKPRNDSNLSLIFEKQTNELIEYYLLIKQRILESIKILENIQHQTNNYQISKQIAENSIEKAKELIVLNENIILSLDDQKIENLLQKYKNIANELKSMSSTIDEYKNNGLILIDTAQRYIDTDSISNEIESIDKTWCEYVEYVLDTIDYIQLHQEDLGEFYQLTNHFMALLNEKQIQLETIPDNELNTFHNDIEKLYEQIELLNQKGELLLQSLGTDSNENQVERVLDTISRNYDNLITRIKVRLDNINNPYQPIPIIRDNISSIRTTLQSTDDLRQQMDEIDLSMNELSELLISSTSDTISIQPNRLTEQFVDNAVVKNELEKRKISLEQLHSNIEQFKCTMTNETDINTIKGLEDKLSFLNKHWLTMKQANDLREENLLLIQACTNIFWSEHNQLFTLLNHLSTKLKQIYPCSTSCEYIKHEQEKYNQLIDDFSNYKIKFQDFLQKHSLQLLTLISDNQQDTEDIKRSIYDVEQQWNHVQIDLNTCQNDLSQAMKKSIEFNSKLDNVSTWLNEKTNIENNNDFEQIRMFKEHLDDKYIDLINLKQDYTDIEQQNEHITKDKHHLVEEQLLQMDSKWLQLNDKMQEHKTLTYETALRQNRIGDVITDITQSLDTCTLKLSLLNQTSSDINLTDVKQIEILIAKFRILLNDIELISYDIEQLKHTDYENKQTVLSINTRWEELHKQTTEKYNFFENHLEQMKLKQKLHDQIFHELQLINKQINESTINTNFSVLIQCLEYIEERIHDEFPNSNNELKKHLIDIKQRTLTKSEELLDLKNSIEFFHKSLQKFAEQLSENERYLNTQKPIQRRFGLYPTLLKQMNEYKTFQNQLETSKEQFNDLNKLAIRLKIDSNSIKNSLTSIQIRWQKILTRTNERRKELEKVFQETKKIVRPVVADIDRIKSEVHRQTSLCQCSNKYDVQQIAEGRYRFGGSQSLRLVRILRSTVMVRVGGGWTALDEFLVRHDPCRAKGRTNYELNSQNYPLRDGVAQTMTLFKQRFVNIRRPTYLFPQQQQSTGSLLKKSPSVTPIRPIKDKCRRTSSTYSLKQQQQQQSTSLSNGDLSMSADDLSVSPRVSSDSETKQSLIPIAITMYTPATSTLSRTSSRDSILSENSFVSTSSSLKHRPSKLPLPINRHRKNIAVYVDSCPLEYRIIDPNHSFCSQPFSNVIEQRVTLSEREYIINKHNYERRRTHGTNLEKMYWNDDLAEIALRHARTCVFEHDKMNQRSIPRIPLSTGQNLAIGYENWTEVIEGWIEEKEYYCHAFPSTNLFSRYAQMIWHSSVLIGCGAVICPPFGSYNISWNFYVCNYITGLLNSNYHAAYRQGIKDHPLHDCHGKVCLYNGTLNLNTCECQCSSYASGSYCEKLNCSKLPQCPYHSSISCVAVDVPLECPRLCGLCDRYEILKHVYGEDNLIPNVLMSTTTTTTTTTEETSIKMETLFEDLQTSNEISSTLILNTTTIMLSTSSKINVSYEIFFYLCIKYFISCI
ncbi:unnamed protein product [Adineta steineri]|uniref:GAR domain-containing protein n=1 Tax=Adineta steineri TaxID=433720 RepID=A0A815TLS4_9BILA|nr:unnamed protein product [Adineta steineri]